MDERWQLYDEQGLPLKDEDRTKDDIFGKGLLHGASHVWVWRTRDGIKEVLVQKRATTKRTWANLYDISAAGHINLGEDPIVAAIRETKEEINLDIRPEQLKLFGVHRAYLVAENRSIENEFQWLYALELTKNVVFIPQISEVSTVQWMPLDTFSRDCFGETYVPHGQVYYQTVIETIVAGNRERNLKQARMQSITPLQPKLG